VERHVTDASHASRAPLRVGFLLDGFEQPRWVALALEQLLKAGCAVPSVVVMNGTPGEQITRLQAYVRNRHQLLYAFYNRFDNKRYSTPDDALQPANVQ
jgi:hypothetical protein